jgi:hypothetical protein
MFEVDVSSATPVVSEAGIRPPKRLRPAVAMLRTIFAGKTANDPHIHRVKVANAMRVRASNRAKSRARA